MPDYRTLLTAAGGLVVVAIVDPLSLPAMLFGLLLGVFIGVSLPSPEPEDLIIPVYRFPVGPVAALRARQPWTEPGFSRWTPMMRRLRVAMHGRVLARLALP